MAINKENVYLAGPIEDVNYDHMTSWRKLASLAFDGAGIGVLDPTRRISAHDQLNEIKIEDAVRSMNICKRIFKQDLMDISHSRVVLVDARRSSGKGTGTAMEIMYAHMKNKIIILWADKDDNVHPFLEAVYSEKHFDFNEAVEAVLEYY